MKERKVTIPPPTEDVALLRKALHYTARRDRVCTAGVSDSGICGTWGRYLVWYVPPEDNPNDLRIEWRCEACTADLFWDILHDQIHHPDDVQYIEVLLALDRCGALEGE